MKFLDKLALKLFSIIIIALTVVAILLLTGILDVDTVKGFFISMTDGETAIKVTIGIFVVLILLALKGLFFTSKIDNAGKDGIILENSNGKLVISKESLENLIASVIKEVPGADSVSSKTVLDRDRNLIVYVTAIVSKDMMIKDVSNEIQERIKDAMKRTADLDVKEVNIKIKNITSKRVKGLPAAPQAKEESVTEEKVQEAQESVDEALEKLDSEESKEDGDDE